MTTPREGRPAKRVVIYLRARIVGGSGQEADTQVERQRQACQRIAEAHGVTVAYEYAASGRTT